MNTRILGADLEVSAIGLGCMGFSHAYGAPTPRGEAVRAIRAAFDLGYTLFDTAETYGTAADPHENEKLVGEALKGVRNRVQIVTKFGIRFDETSTAANKPLIPDSRPGTIRSSVEGSLRRLGTDHIDLYFQHRMDPKVEPETVAQVMADLIREGKITHWGISEASEDYLRRAHAVCPVTAVQNRYSIMARQHEALFPALEELHIGFVAFSPMANGLLTGAYGKNDTFDPRLDYRSAMPQFTPRGRRPEPGAAGAAAGPGGAEGGHVGPDLPGLDAVQKALHRPHPRQPEGGADAGERRSGGGLPLPRRGGGPGQGPGRHPHVRRVRRYRRQKQITISSHMTQKG